MPVLRSPLETSLGNLMKEVYPAPLFLYNMLPGMAGPNLLAYWTIALSFSITICLSEKEYWIESLWQSGHLDCIIPFIYKWVLVLDIYISIFPSIIIITIMAVIRYPAYQTTPDIFWVSDNCCFEQTMNSKNPCKDN